MNTAAENALRADSLKRRMDERLQALIECEHAPTSTGRDQLRAAARAAIYAELNEQLDFAYWQGLQDATDDRQDPR